MDLGLSGKKALVTGASKGLGFATARLLALEGARIAINSRNPQNLNEAAWKIRSACGQEVAGFPGDVSEPQFPESLVTQTAEKLGGLDLLFTNAGGPPPGRFEILDDAAWQGAIQASFMSHVRLIRAALPHLRKSSAPSVLAVTSYSVKHPYQT